MASISIFSNISEGGGSYCISNKDPKTKLFWLAKNHYLIRWSYCSDEYSWNQGHWVISGNILFKIFCTRNFMWPSIQRRQCPNYNNTLKNHYLINSREDTIIFLGWKLIIFHNSFLFSFSRNAHVTFVGKPQLNLISFKNDKYWWSDKVFKVLLWIGHCHFCMGGHLHT